MHSIVFPIDKYLDLASVFIVNNCFSRIEFLSELFFCWLQEISKSPNDIRLNISLCKFWESCLKAIEGILIHLVKKHIFVNDL